MTEVEKEVAPAVDEPPPAGERLALVLEDEEDVRQTLCEQLHQLGWLTLETASGEEALQLLEASPDIALLISDLMLPGAPERRRRDPYRPTPLSGAAGAVDQRPGFASGAESGPAGSGVAA